MQRWLRNVQKRVMHVQSWSFANINQFLFTVLLSSLSLLSKNFATMVTWHHTSLYTHCEPLLRRECHHEFWETCASGGLVLLMPLESKACLLAQKKKRFYWQESHKCRGGWGGAAHQSFVQGGFHLTEVQPLNLLNTAFDRKGSPFIYQYLLLTNGTTLFTC